MQVMKYILVTGGVLSGVGKGIISSSIGTILKSSGLSVTCIKIDPYINIDAGTFSPLEHGEVFVLDDGGEVDLDLGNYERFLDVTLTKANNITTGKIYQQVINNERQGKYLGKTVQVVPHITEAIINWVEKVSRMPVDGEKVPDVCLIELGGTIGDIESMPFVEAFRQLQFRVKRDNFVAIHASLVPQLGKKDDDKSKVVQKTKPTQASVRELRGLGIIPDLIVARSRDPLTEAARIKIATMCNVEQSAVLGVHDVESLYQVPIILDSQNATNFLIERLQLNVVPMKGKRKLLTKWRDLAHRSNSFAKEVNIALVGKYVVFEDSYVSVIKALEHASLACNRKLKLIIINSQDLEDETQHSNTVGYHEAMQKLCTASGIIVPGGFDNRGWEGKIKAAEWARKNKVPFLGICLGMQCAVIEFARSILGIKNANSIEMVTENSLKNKAVEPLVIDMPEHEGKDNMGGTMRLGSRKTLFDELPSTIRQLYGDIQEIEERHRHRFEVNPIYQDQLAEKGLIFVGSDPSEGENKLRLEIMELKDHPYFVGTQFHPEYKTRPLKPSPPYLGLILAATNKLHAYLNRKNNNNVLRSNTSCQSLVNIDSASGSEESDNENNTDTLSCSFSSIKVERTNSND